MHHRVVSAFLSILAVGRHVPREVGQSFIEEWLKDSEGHFEGMYRALIDFMIEDKLLQSVQIPTLFVDGADSPYVLKSLASRHQPLTLL